MEDIILASNIIDAEILRQSQNGVDTTELCQAVGLLIKWYNNRKGVTQNEIQT